MADRLGNFVGTLTTEETIELMGICINNLDVIQIKETLVECLGDEDLDELKEQLEDNKI